MKIVIATTPAPGHVNPMLGLARILLAEGHQVLAFTGRAFQQRVEAIGATFRPIPASADQDVVDPFAKYPEFKTLPPGWSCFASFSNDCSSTTFLRSTEH
jgi:UDP:flavonoid glycosyltransferase YjiC (YdhE family)